MNGHGGKMCEIKAGDTIYFETFSHNGRVNHGIKPHKVIGLRTYLLVDVNELFPIEIPIYEIGKTVFTTQKEARGKLKK